MSSSVTITDFLNNELVDYASYSTLRAIPSCIDGFKNSHRKIIYGALKSLTKETKVNVFSGIVSVETQYLHGDLSPVCVTLARDFCGSNNLPLLYPSGNFGSRLIPESSASRYIFIRKQNYFSKVILDDDLDILEKQEFEGDEIEPRFFVPTIPLVLINGANGIATGFSSKILQRDTTNIIEYLRNYLQGKECDERLLLPQIKDFDGSITQDKENTAKFSISGNIEIVNTNKKQIIITEVPIGYDLRTFSALLDKLEEKSIIKKYEDLSDDNRFKFVLHVDGKFLSKSKDEILTALGLIKSFTENYCVLDEYNKVLELNSAKEIIDYYISIKLKYLEKRKAYLIQKHTLKLNELISVLTFIKMVLENEISLKTQNKAQIEKILQSNNKIVSKNNSYDYLFKIPILNLTPQKVQDIELACSKLEKVLKGLEKTTIQKMWIQDLDELEKSLV